MDADRIFQALADPARRELLDRILRRSGQSLVELSHGMGMSRQAVAKHLTVLVEADLVVTRAAGRQKLHYLNPLPMRAVLRQWLKKYERLRLSDLMPDA